MRHPSTFRSLFSVFLALACGLMLPPSWGSSVGNHSKRSRAQVSASDVGQSSTLLPDGLLLLLGGQGSDGPVATAALQDPQTGAVTVLPNGLLHARAGHTATLLPDGTVFVFGGLDAAGRLVTVAESFDPVAQTSTNLPPTGLTPRAYHSATLLTDGRLLVVGGMSGTGDTLGTIETWDFRTNAASGIPPGLLVPRSKQSSTLLPDGTVLIWGGFDKNGLPLNYGEVFDPSTDRSRIETVPIQAAASQLPPQLEASLPADQSTNVPVNTMVALRFSKRLAVVSANAQTVILSGPAGPVTAKVVPAESGMLAFVTPESTLLTGTTYSLSLSGLTDGNLSLLDTTVTFTTAGASAGDGGAAGGTGGDPDDTGSQALNSPYAKLPPLQAPPGVTAVAGQALRLNGEPLVDVTLSIGTAVAKTDTTGRFLLSNIGSGHQVLLIDGSTANKEDRTYGIFEAGVNVLQGQTNALPYTIWMTRLDTAHAVTIPSPTVSQDTVITTPRLPGLELHLPANTTIYDHNWNVVRTISITPVPLDKPPFPLPQDVQVPIYFTIQPGGAYIKVNDPSGTYTGARLIYPNTYNAKPGTIFQFWNYDPDQKGWYVYGEGKVSEDGRSVIPNPGVEIYQFTGAMVAGSGIARYRIPTDSEAAEPVKLSTGDFVYRKTDLFLPDVIPLALARTYVTNDSVARQFGIGAMQFYDIFMVGNTNPYTYQELCLPDGERIYFYRTSPGTTYTSAIYASTSSQSMWYGATLSFNVTAFPAVAWVLTTRDGTNYYFPDGDAKTDPRQVGLLGIRDRYGNTVTITRDPSGNITQVTSPNGRYITFQHDSSNRITQAQDISGRTVSYTYDSGGRLSTVTDANGGVTTYTYDSNNNMLTIKDPLGIVYLTNQYDSDARVSQQTLADGSTYQFSWVAGTTQGQVFAEQGGVPTGGSPQQVIAFRTCTTCSEGYPPLISQANVTDPRGIVREVQFGATGQVTSDTYALGQPEQRTFTYTYYADNLIQSITDQLGRVTDYSFDASGNVTQITRLAGTSNAVTTSLTFDPNFGQLTSITDPLNHTTSISLDNLGNPTAVTDPLGHQISMTFNGEGQPLTISDPLGNQTQFTYFGGDLASITDPLGRTTNRFTDDAGRVISAVDPAGEITRFSYNPLNLLTSTTNPMSGATSFTYDGNGNLLTVTDANNHTTTYTYNSMDRLATRTDPLSRAESYQYDGNGNLTQFTDRRAKVTTYTYDNLNRRTFAGFGTQSGPTYESTVSYTYDAGSHLTQAVDSVTGTITRSYDGLDRLTSEATPEGTVSYTYDAAGRRTSLTVPGQSVANYTFDATNRLTQIAQGSTTVSFGYDSANRRTSLTLPNGIVVSYGYDTASELTGLTYTLGSNTLGNLTYSYDLAGRRTSMGGSYAQTNLPNAISATAYDAANELTQWGTANPSYDANGNMLSDGTNSFVWNARNQLASMNMTGESFQYDPFGRRVTKTIVGTTTNFLYDGVNPVQEQSGGSVVANLLTGGVDEYFQRTDSSGARSFLADALGSTFALTDSTGTVQTSYNYDPFGNTTFNGSSTSTYQYTGRENDGTGVYFYRARYYNPTTGRFLSEDPIEFAAGDTNLYRYVFNNPVNSIDPTGFFPTGRDKWWGHNDRNFQWWWHNCYWKGEPYDGTKEEVEAGWVIWNGLGRPPKGKCGDNKPCREPEPAPEPAPEPEPEEPGPDSGPNWKVIGVGVGVVAVGIGVAVLCPECLVLPAFAM
jgi:RHS repeat-associated protein